MELKIKKGLVVLEIVAIVLELVLTIVIFNTNSNFWVDVFVSCLLVGVFIIAIITLHCSRKDR